MSDSDEKIASAKIIKFGTKESSSPESRVTRFGQHWQAHQVIEAEDAWAAGEVGFVCRALVQATLPYREPKGNPPAWGRTNGKVSLVIQPGYYFQRQQEIVKGKTREIQVPTSIGYPYGGIPRILTAWVGREVKLKKEREIVLGSSLKKFMEELGITNATGGKNGSITRLREQMRRLFSAKIAVVDNPEPVNAFDYLSTDSFSLVDKSQIWWDPKSPEQCDLFDSRILLSERFFNEMVNSPVPVDMRVLKHFKNSPSALDLYCYLTYRAFTLRKNTTIPWDVLRLQFGSEIQSERKFRQQFGEALKAVLVVYPEARVDLDQKGLLLKPSATSVRALIKKA